MSKNACWLAVSTISLMTGSCASEKPAEKKKFTIQGKAKLTNVAADGTVVPSSQLGGALSLVIFADNGVGWCVRNDFVALGLSLVPAVDVQKFMTDGYEYSLTIEDAGFTYPLTVAPVLVLQKTVDPKHGCEIPAAGGDPYYNAAAIWGVAGTDPCCQVRMTTVDIPAADATVTMPDITLPPSTPPPGTTCPSSAQTFDLCDYKKAPGCYDALGADANTYIHKASGAACD